MTTQAELASIKEKLTKALQGQRGSPRFDIGGALDATIIFKPIVSLLFLAINFVVSLLQCATLALAVTVSIALIPLMGIGFTLLCDLRFLVGHFADFDSALLHGLTARFGDQPSRTGPRNHIGIGLYYLCFKLPLALIALGIVCFVASIDFSLAMNDKTTRWPTTPALNFLAGSVGFAAMAVWWCVFVPSSAGLTMLVTKYIIGGHKPYRFGYTD
ncbi:Aste57867_19752 [Aphanomyces stellatus]|uniref:Aste57867_19752 protein n=1 Tax=Aphanomyces stellatus TaxID=120398 RepID=A0A485LDB0_9STRA|nr:hypothetical protein As57867_019687 [Aphanomyces stellatus]VFT96450.1 Aste57867_19752 [Aphanomyces stellatus]